MAEPRLLSFRYRRREQLSRINTLRLIDYIHEFSRVVCRIGVVSPPLPQHRTRLYHPATNRAPRVPDTWFKQAIFIQVVLPFQALKKISEHQSHSLVVFRRNILPLSTLAQRL